MYLTKIQIQGFKTFANKTVLNFSSDQNDIHDLTVIIGPNGSGKSNLADAIRWCLGEQSMKLLRGKKTEDIIFSGSKGKGRSGFAEVELTFNNSDRAMNVDYVEVTITRRIFRDGESKYLLNGKKVRLSEIQLLLAEAGIGQKTYTVVAQGMIDHVLIASPEERKVFFDDATGVRGLQIKRHQSLLKLRKATENLVDIEMLLAEIEPRLRLLKRQVNRLEKRENIENELKALQTIHYGTSWWNLKSELEKIQIKLRSSNKEVNQKKNELNTGDEKLIEMENNNREKSSVNNKLSIAQSEYRKAQEAVHLAQQKKFDAERTLELAKVQSQTNWSPLPLQDIISELNLIQEDQKKILKHIKELKNIEDISNEIESVFKKSKKLKDRLTKPNLENYKADPKMLEAVEIAKIGIQKAKENVDKAEKRIDEISKAESGAKTEIFAFQRELRKIQSELYSLEQSQNVINIEKARIETRIEGLSKEMREEIPKLQNEIKNNKPNNIDKNQNETRTKIFKLKNQLELIGGIEEETIEEYKETDERFNFLTTQLEDLKKAIKTTNKIIDELDERIQVQSEKAFKAINEEFKKFFKILFGGGSCSLIKMRESETEKNEIKISMNRPGEEMAEAMQKNNEEEDESSAKSALKQLKKRRDTVTGIEIQATPPGKRLKSLNLLSGGERALTSIALLSAIMATNPSPFVVLDEVDAALDEANTVRFANILDELRKLSQFIIVTHNRATMERADNLYGVTMGDDGISNLLSVKMTDIDENGTTRR